MERARVVPGVKIYELLPVLVQIDLQIWNMNFVERVMTYLSVGLFMGSKRRFDSIQLVWN